MNQKRHKKYKKLKKVLKNTKTLFSEIKAPLLVNIIVLIIKKFLGL